MSERFVTGSTGLVVTVPEAADAVAALRAEHDPSVAYGVPVHVTVLYPWLAESDIDEATRAQLAEFAAGQQPFDVELSGAGRFPGVAWLAPRPADRFVALTSAVWARWPHAAPYGGRFAEATPHLTVADGQPEPVIDGVVARLEQLAPIRFRVEALELLVYDGVRWQVRAAITLGAADAVTRGGPSP